MPNLPRIAWIVINPSRASYLAPTRSSMFFTSWKLRLWKICIMLLVTLQKCRLQTTHSLVRFCQDNANYLKHSLGYVCHLGEMEIAYRLFKYHLNNRLLFPLFSMIWTEVLIWGKYNSVSVSCCLFLAGSSLMEHNAGKDKYSIWVCISLWTPFWVLYLMGEQKCLYGRHFP